MITKEQFDKNINEIIPLIPFPDDTDCPALSYGEVENICNRELSSKDIPTRVRNALKRLAGQLDFPFSGCPTVGIAAYVVACLGLGIKKQGLGVGDKGFESLLCFFAARLKRRENFITAANVAVVFLKERAEEIQREIELAESAFKCINNLAAIGKLHESGVMAFSLHGKEVGYLRVRPQAITDLVHNALQAQFREHNNIV